MLTIELNHCYSVIPSWADIGVAWTDLRDLFEHPQEHEDLLDINDILWLKEKGKYPPAMPPCRLFDGPAGGGIIFTDESNEKPPGTLFYLLGGRAQWTQPLGMGGRPNPITTTASVLEARGDLPLILGRRLPAKQYCSVSPEHAESAGDDIYWVADYTSGRMPPEGLQRLPELANAFGVTAEFVEQPPKELLDETRLWFPSAQRRQCWLRVAGGGTNASFHFAVLMYSAFHLKWLAGRRLRAMNLIAQIEDKANYRRNWQTLLS